MKDATCLQVEDNKLFLCGGNIDMFADLSKASFALKIEHLA
jgi:hypothetical protein